MLSDSYQLDWNGPYRFFGQGKAALLLNENSLTPGVYIWTVLVATEHWAYYIGETGKMFAQRHLDHLRSYFSGEYRIYDTAEFTEGKKSLVWGGAYGQRNRHKLSEFRDREKYFLKNVQEFVSLLNIFLISFPVDQRLRKRLEAALASELKGQPGLVGKFQDDDIRYDPTRADESPISCNFVRPLPIVGLSDKVQIMLSSKR
jgi:hypothetical protein